MVENWAACFAAPTEKEENRAVKYNATGAQPVPCRHLLITGELISHV